MRDFRSWAAKNRVAVVAIAGLASLCTALYCTMGAGYTIDDWPLIRNVELRGFWHLLDPAPWDRPVSGAYWMVAFGLGAHHPLVPALFGLAFSIASGLLIYDLVRMFASARTGLVAGLLWVLLPTHSSLEMWLTTTAIGMSLALALGALRVGCGQSAARRPIALLLTALALFSYETTAALLIPGFILTTWLAYGRVDRKLVAGASALTVAALVYVYLTVYSFGPDYRGPGTTPNLLYVLPANFGWGVAPTAALELVTVAVGFGGAMFAMLELLRARRSGEPAERDDQVVLVGLAVLALGTVPYVRYVYWPQGAGDRFNVVSGVGAALVWAGVFAHLARRAKALAVVAFALLIGCASVTRWNRTHLWSAASDDARKLIEIARAKPPQPNMVVGSKFVLRSTITGIGYDDRAESIVQYAYGTESVHARWVRDEADWEATPPKERLDLSSVSAVLGADLLGHG